MFLRLHTRCKRGRLIAVCSFVGMVGLWSWGSKIYDFLVFELSNTCFGMYLVIRHLEIPVSYAGMIFDVDRLATSYFHFNRILSEPMTGNQGMNSRRYSEHAIGIRI